MIKLTDLLNEIKSVLNLRKVHKEIMRKVNDIDGTTIRKGNRLTGIKQLEVHSEWFDSFMVNNMGDIWTNNMASSLGGTVKSEKELYKFINDEIMERRRRFIKNNPDSDLAKQK